MSTFPSERSLLVVNQKWPRNPRAYFTLTACFFCMFNSWGLVNAYGTFQSFYNETFLPDSNLALLNLVGSSECFFVLILSWLVGRLLDAGYYRKLLFSGMALTTIGTCMLSLTGTQRVVAGEIRHIGSYGLVWLTQGFVTALGQASLFVASSQIVSTWFKKTKYFSIGIVACGASIAGVVYPFAVKYLIQNIGWKPAVLCVGGIVGFTGMISLLFAMPNPEHHIRPIQKWNSTSTWIDTHAFDHLPYIFFVASISALFFGFYPVFFNLEEWAVSAGVGYRDSAIQLDENHPVGFRTVYLLAIMNGASSVGRLTAGYISDHWGALNVHCGVTLISSLFVLLLWTFSKTTDTALAFVILFGIVSGAVIGLPPASVADILGHEPSQQAKLGQWVGMMYTVAAPFALVGPVIGGYLINHYNTFLTVQLWSGFCLLVSAIFMVCAIWARHREVLAELAQGGWSRWSKSFVSSRVVSEAVTRNPSDVDVSKLEISRFPSRNEGGQPEEIKE